MQSTSICTTIYIACYVSVSNSHNFSIILKAKNYLNIQFLDSFAYLFSKLPILKIVPL